MSVLKAQQCLCYSVKQLPTLNKTFVLCACCTLTVDFCDTTRDIPNENVSDAFIGRKIQYRKKMRYTIKCATYDKKMR